MFDIRINEIDVLKADLEKTKAGFIALSETMVEILRGIYPDRTDIMEYYNNIFAEKIAMTRGVTLEGENTGEIILTKYPETEGIRKWKIDERN